MDQNKDKYNYIPEEEDQERSTSTAAHFQIEGESPISSKLPSINKKYSGICTPKRLILLSVGVLLLAIIPLAIYFLRKPTEDPNPQFYQEGIPKDLRKALLCNLSGPLKRRCETTDMAESLQYAYAFNPYYAYPNTVDTIRFMHHVNSQDYLVSLGARCVVVEGIYAKDGQGPVLEGYNPECLYFKVELEDYIYYRENLANVFANKLLEDWEVLLLIDSHQIFSNQYWLLDSIYAASHYKAVQLFDRFVKLDYDNSTISSSQSSLAHYERDHYPKGNTGNAWAVEKDVWLEMDYLPDKCISGLCDTSLAYAAVSSNETPFEDDILKWGKDSSKDPYLLYSIIPWMKEAKKSLQGSQTYLKTTLYHFEHEHHFNWTSMGRAIKKCGYGFESLKRDDSLMLHLTNDCIKDYMHEYYDFFSSANRLFSSPIIFLFMIFIVLFF